MAITSENFVFISAILLFAAVMAGKTAYRFGAPALLLFLAVGMLFGYQLISFDSPELTQFIGMIALSIILFSGGMDTKIKEIRPIMTIGVGLATLGVALTALVLGGFIYAIMPLFGFEFSFIQSLLLAAMMSSTDSASVFSILRSKKTLFPQKKKKRRFTVQEAFQIALSEESEKLVDEDAIKSEAIYRAENDGIVFIDEIDKIAGKGNRNGADVSREGVQRDILPIVEGSTVVTKYGPIKTDFILFIAAGAFHVAAVEDLIPELQGRFPVSVELQSLTKEDFVKILTETENSLTFQYGKLLSVDNIDLQFDEGAIERIAEVSVELNLTSEDIGARRLHTVMEYLLEDISFNAGGDYPMFTLHIDRKYVDEHLRKLTGDRNLKKYVL